MADVTSSPEVPAKTLFMFRRRWKSKETNQVSRVGAELVRSRNHKFSSHVDDPQLHIGLFAIFFPNYGKGFFVDSVWSGMIFDNHSP